MFDEVCILFHYNFVVPFPLRAILILPFQFTVRSLICRKVNCTLVQALRFCTGRTAHRGSRGIALLFLYHGTRRGEGSASLTGRCLPPEKTRYPFYGRLGWAPGPVWTGAENLAPPPGFDPRTVQPVTSRYTD